MRSSFTLAVYAQFGTIAVMPTALGQLWLPSAGLFAFLILYAIGHVFEHGWNQPPEVTRSRPRAVWVILGVWVMYPLFFAMAVGSSIAYGTWGPAPVLVVCLGSYVLSFIFRVRENRAIALVPRPRPQQHSDSPEAYR
ncbi:hypothetical protein NE857_20260 [Nocardiopsis exhalans]|uniref:Uncharacterized protein n=1 Tax=Nocardiopsis exhalans TaxID=163604 RepID=A0ABY5D2M2_9ACTN|nr:hypothetical protein [Nocardiopsis exhalans]USY17665.1 hypothetical protein NE857_20260 [Nocardiopsis exhalans]